MKRIIDSATSAVLKSKEDVPKLQAKGYPSMMCDFFMTKADELMAVVDTTKTQYSKAVIDNDEGDPTKVDAVEALVKDIETAVASLEQAKKDYENHFGADIKKLC